MKRTSPQCLDVFLVPATTIPYTCPLFETYRDDFVVAYSEPESPRLVHAHVGNRVLKDSKVGAWSPTAQRKRKNTLET